MTNLKDASPTYLDQIKAGTSVSLEVPTLQSFDSTTKLITCDARVTFQWPPQIVARLISINSSVDWAKDTNEGTYTVQPESDGKGLVYSLSSPILDGTVGSARQMISTLAEADTAAQAKAEAAKIQASEDAAAQSAADAAQGGGPAQGPSTPN